MTFLLCDLPVLGSSEQEKILANMFEVMSDKNYSHILNGGYECELIGCDVIEELEVGSAAMRRHCLPSLRFHKRPLYVPSGLRQRRATR